MNKQNQQTLSAINEALELIPEEPKREIKEALNRIESDPDELISATLGAVLLILEKDFGVIA